MTTASAAPAILDYAVAPPIRPRRWRWLLLAVSLPALVAPFMSFYWGISPWAALVESFADRSVDTIPLALIGFGFFTAFPAMIWRAHALWRAPASRTRRVYLGFALLGLMAMLWLNAWGYREVIRRWKEGNGLWETLTDGYPFLAAMPIAVAGLMISWRLTSRGDADRAAAVVLMTPYLANAAICLVAFADDDPSLSYLLTLFVALLWTLEIVADAIRIVHRR